MSTETLTLGHLGHAHEVFHDDIIYFKIGCAFFNRLRIKKGVLTILARLTLIWLYKYICDSHMMFTYL